MKRIIKVLIVLGSLAGLGWLVSGPIAARWKEHNRIKYRDAEVTRGRIVAVVNSTGTIKPIRSVQVGTFVSGPIAHIPKNVGFNAEVTTGQLLALIDPRIYQANVDRDKAVLDMQEANLKQVDAKLQQAINDEKRSLILRKENKGFISDSEIDQFKFNRMSLEAQLAVAGATVEQAAANLATSKANLKYTEIRSPVDGMVIEQKIDEGQTVAATFQTPDLFIVAPNMRKEMHVYASVDETDIGLVHTASLQGMVVKFTIDSYPDDLFEGRILQVRNNSTTTQNVVTYPVIVSAPNPDLKLKPGATANISFQVGEAKNTLRIPNAALRFFPQRNQVRTEDRKLLEIAVQGEDGEEEQAATTRSAEEKAETRRLRHRRHVWVLDGDELRAIEVIIGLNDSKYTELVSGDLKVGTKLVTGIQPRN